jgi:hypothetical protein
VLSGGSEQPLAGAEPHGSAEVSVRSKDNGARLVVWEADVSHVPAESEEWQALAPQLLAKRLNTPDGEAAPARWARECTLVKLVPTGRLVESPDAPDTGSGALPPPPTPAATRVPVPFTLGRRQRWRQR